MINTITIKEQQLARGYFSTGTGKETILILGSCRSVPYVYYLDKWNKANGDRFTINAIDPFSWNWDMQENRVDYMAELTKQESNKELLDMLKRVDIFIHEYYSNAGMFNVFKEGEKNIYQFGLKPKQDICLPNYNDIFILTREIVSFDMEIRHKAIADYNVIGKLSEQTLSDIDQVRKNNLNKFIGICAKTDFPEFAQIFMDNYKKKRFFWTFNHIAKEFTLTIYRLLNDKFLKLYLSDFYWDIISKHDMYANNFTYLCEYDIGYEWNEEVKQLKEIL